MPYSFSAYQFGEEIGRDSNPDIVSSQKIVSNNANILIYIPPVGQNPPNDKERAIRTDSTFRSAPFAKRLPARVPLSNETNKSASSVLPSNDPTRSINWPLRALRRHT